MDSKEILDEKGEISEEQNGTFTDEKPRRSSETSKRINHFSPFSQVSTSVWLPQSLRFLNKTTPDAGEVDPLDPEGHLPQGIPWIKLIILCILISCDTLGVTYLFPFLAFMVADFGYTGNSNGFYSGILASSFSFAQFLSSILHGIAADRFGRRPVILYGLLGNTIFLFAFGLSPNYGTALLFRFLAGFSNGNIGVTKTYLAEISRKKHHPRVFSILGFLWGLGGIVGPLLAGFLAQPASKYNAFDNSFWQRFPYFLPSLIIVFYQMIGLVVGAIYLTEPPRKKKYRPKKSKQKDEEAEVIEMSLLGNQVDGESPKEQNTSIEWEEEEEKPKVRTLKGFLKESYEILKTKSVLVASLLYAIIALCYIMYDELYSIWARTPIDQGGLSFSTDDIGFCLSISGITTMVVQLTLFPIVSKRLSDVMIYRIGCLLSMTFFFGFFFSHEFIRFGKGVAFWVLINITTSVKCFASTLCFTPIFLIVNNAAPENQLGAANGVGQSAAGFARAFGPFLAGGLYSWSLGNNLPYPFDYHFVGNVAAMMMLGAFCISFLSTKRPTYNQIEPVSSID